MAFGVEFHGLLYVKSDVLGFEDGKEISEEGLERWKGGNGEVVGDHKGWIQLAITMSKHQMLKLGQKASVFRNVMDSFNKCQNLKLVLGLWERLNISDVIANIV